MSDAEKLKEVATQLSTAAEVLDAAAKGRGNPILMRRTAEDLKNAVAVVEALTASMSDA